MEKTKFCVICIEFQLTGSPHVHSFMFSVNTLNIQNEAPYLAFIKVTINAQLPGHLNDPDVLSQLKFKRFMLTLQLTGNTTKMNVASRMVNVLRRRPFLQTTLF